MNAMTLLSKFNPFRKRSIENPAVPLTGETYRQFHGGGRYSTAGQFVTDWGMLSYSPVWSALWMISDDVAKLPLITYRTRDPWERERARDHAAYRVLRRHTGELTAFDWLSSSIANALLYGGSVTRIIRSPDNRQLALKFYSARKWSMVRENGRNVYLLTDDDDVQRAYSELEVIHLKGLSMDGHRGLSILEFARNTVGRALAAEQFGDGFYSNGIMPQGWFMHPGNETELTDEGAQRLLDKIEARHRERRSFGLLREGMRFEPAGITPSDALLIDALNWGVKDAARFFKIPPHKLGDDAKTSYNSIEQENRAYLDSTLMPWTAKLEFEINHKLFTRREQATLFAEFETNAFLRPTVKDRFAAYATAVQWGIMTRNECRDRENLNRLEGLDEPLTPMNMAVGAEPPQTLNAIESDAADSRAVIARDLVASEMQRHCKRILFAAASKSRARSTSPDRVATFVSQFTDSLETDLMRQFSATSKLVADVNGGQPGRIATQLAGAVVRHARQRIGESIADCPVDEMADRITAEIESVYRDCSEFASDLVLED